MPTTAGGRWTPPIYRVVPPAPPVRRPAPAPSVVREDAAWGPSTLTGPQTVTVGKTKFAVPEDATVKTNDRAGIAWIRVGNFVHVLTDRGELKMSAEERAALRWDLL